MNRRLSTEQRRAELIAAGKRIFAGSAYDAVSTDALAAATGTSKGLLYHYFGSKRGFYLAVIRAAADELLAATQLPDGADEVTGIATSITGFVDFVVAQGELFVAVVRGGVGSDSEVEQVVTRVREQLVARFAEAVGLSEDDTVEIARIWGWLGYAEGLAIYWVERRPFGAETLEQLLLESLARLLPDP